MAVAIIDYLVNDLLCDIENLSIEAGENLLQLGYIDSLGIIKLVSHLEATNGIQIKPGEITLKNFITVQAMVEFIQRKQSEL